MPSEVKEIPGRDSNATVELLFMAEEIPPLGLLSYHVERSEGGVAPVLERLNVSWSSNNTNVTAPLETSHEEPDDIEVDNGVSCDNICRYSMRFSCCGLGTTQGHRSIYSIF